MGGDINSDFAMLRAEDGVLQKTANPAIGPYANETEEEVHGKHFRQVCRTHDLKVITNYYDIGVTYYAMDEAHNSTRIDRVAILTVARQLVKNCCMRK